ncbi:MAG: HD domain-containing protein [Candidatus Paceibacterota bacterium]
MEQRAEVLEAGFRQACEDVGIKEEDRLTIESLLAPLRNKNAVTHAHYLHSLRVSLIARAIGKHTHHEEKPLLFAGALHDIGKALTPVEVMGKTGPWTEADQRVMQQHVMDSYRLLRGRFDFTAEIILWHHRFQEHGYPRVLPKPLREYSEPTKLLVVEYGRLLALADVYDALHRPNSKFKEGHGLSDEEVKEQMFALNPDKKKLVASLYEAGVFAV